MSPNTRRRLKRFVLSASIAVAGTIAAGVLLGPLAALILGVIGFLVVAAVSDDGLGTCLILAVLLLIGLVLLVLVFVAVVKVNTAGADGF